MAEEPTLVPIPLNWQVESRHGLTIVTVSGTVDTDSGPVLYRTVTQCLEREPSAVVVELSGTVISDPQTAKAFSMVVQQAQLWPGTPVLLCGLDPSAADMISNEADEPLPLYATLNDALSTHIGGHDDVVSEVLLPVTGAARRGRDIVTQACLRWDLPHLIPPAVLVTSELVTNAVMHAHSTMTLQMKLRPQYLFLAVSDGDHAEPIPRNNLYAETPGGRGLRLVESAATRWGYQRQPDGKAVWASFARSPTARPRR